MQTLDDLFRRAGRNEESLTGAGREVREAELADGGRLVGERLLLVDRDGSCQAFQEFGGAPEVLTERAEWSDFLKGWLPEASYRDHLVPTPWAPHLLCDWLAADLGAEVVEPPRGWRLPY